MNSVMSARGHSLVIIFLSLPVAPYLPRSLPLPLLFVFVILICFARYHLKREKEWERERKPSARMTFMSRHRRATKMFVECIHEWEFSTNMFLDVLFLVRSTLLAFRCHCEWNTELFSTNNAMPHKKTNQLIKSRIHHRIWQIFHLKWLKFHWTIVFIVEILASAMIQMAAILSRLLFVYRNRFFLSQNVAPTSFALD